MEQFYQLAFWVAVLKIIWINILLSGDNAVVIALACRNLPPRQRRWGLMIGAGVASLLLIVFTAVISSLMTRPYLKLIGGCILLWIAFRLLVPAAEDEEGHVEGADDLWRAVRIVVVADVVMSFDNVIGVAAAANGSYVLLGLGLAVSIPLVIGGAALIMALFERYPILVWAGAALLGWIAGDLLGGDLAVQQFLAASPGLTFLVDSTILGVTVVELMFALAGAVGVVAAAGWCLRARRTAAAQVR
jgi:YjbE family integral membrane protein